MIEEIDESQEPHLISAWINDEGYASVEIAAYLLEGPKNFGRFLADVARHGALAYATTWSLDENKSLQEIVEGFCEQLRDQNTEIIKMNDGSLN